MNAPPVDDPVGQDELQLQAMNNAQAFNPQQLYSFEPEVYDFVYSTLKEHAVIAWEKDGPVESKSTGLLLVDIMACFQDGLWHNKMFLITRTWLLQLALIYSGHYEIIEEPQKDNSGNPRTLPSGRPIVKKILYLIIPLVLRQGRFNQALKDIIKKYVSDRLKSTDRNGVRWSRYLYTLGPGNEDFIDRIDQDVDQKIAALSNAVDKPPSNQLVLGPNYVPSDDIVTDLLEIGIDDTVIYKNRKNKLFDVNRVPLEKFNDVARIYAKRVPGLPIAEGLQLLVKDREMSHKTFEVTQKALTLTRKSNLLKELNVPSNIYEQRRRKVHILSHLLAVGASYATPNIVSEFLEADDDTARKILTTFSAKRTTE